MNKEKIAKGWIVAICLSAITVQAQADMGPLPVQGSGLIYYQIGGGRGYAMAAFGNQTIPLFDASIHLRSNYSCGKFDLKATVDNMFNDLTNSISNASTAITQGITGALASLPMYLLARANPDLAKVFSESYAEITSKFEMAVKSCEAIERDILAGTDPYADLVTVSMANGWKKEMGLAGGAVNKDPVRAKKTVEQNKGKEGIPWVGGQNAGGQNQPPLRPIRDITRAGFNMLKGRDPNDTSPLPPDDPLAKLGWERPADAEEWVTKVVGDSRIVLTNDGPRQAQPGLGLRPEIESYAATNAIYLRELVNGVDSSGNPKPLTLTNLEEVSAPNVAITREVIEAIRNEDKNVQAILINNLAREAATAKAISRALLARQILQSGVKEPNVVGSVDINKIKDNIEELDRAIEDALYEKELASRLVSDTVVTILRREGARRAKAAGLPFEKPVDRRPLQNGAVQ